MSNNFTNISQPQQPIITQPISSAPSSTEGTNGVTGTTTTTTTTTTTATVSGPSGANQKSVILTTNFTIPPTQCPWFKSNEIHEIEVNQLPEFFTGRSPSKTPEIYREYRDFMINTYLQNPYQYLTLTAVRRNLVGDVCSILRVHSFLEHWGIINYFVNPDGGGYIPLPTHQSSTNPSSTSTTSNTSTTTSSTTIEVEKDEKKENESITNPNEKSKKTANGSSSKNSALEIRNNIFGQPWRYSCTRCGADCSLIRYTLNTSGKSLNLDGIPPDYFVMLCSTCFEQGSYDSFLAPTHFTRIEQPVPEQLDEWSDQETLLLLEALDIYSDSWTDVADHVGTKTKEQCLLHFLRLPIEDSYLEDNITKSTSNGIHRDLDYSSHSAELNNPVLSLISFLSSATSPLIASVAAKAASDALQSESKENGTSDKMDTSEDTESNSLSNINIQSAASATLAAASIKAKALTKVEEKEIQNLVLNIINAQTKKLEVKLQYYSDLEDNIEKERQELEKKRQELFSDRYSLYKQQQLLQQQAQAQQHQQLLLQQQQAQQGQQSQQQTSQPIPQPPLSNPMVNYTLVPNKPNDSEMSIV
ncbi:myb domain-containing protein [Tieghemostelium lacteum]|uniref:Myb domain-containing protein n=1 Tax=Tieghemostelium lacteum TaxID=361077 RepID=A0A152A7E6_TIELA|nr:myb domain-containing protein [Tieghemostelium lacteum]|eukprot:KYR02160.1 myb domain-containing protein [Tieghemostelium lacteum]